MSTNTFSRSTWPRLTALLLLFSLLLAAGCGGGNQNGSQSQVSGVSRKGKGRVQMVVDWPARARAILKGTRYIPAYAASLHFEMYQAASPDTRYVTTANRPNDRPSSQTVSFDDLIPEGTYTLAGVARAGTDGQGETVASAATQVKVVANQTFTVNLTLNSVIKSLSVLPQNPVSVGTTLPLAAQALDPDGKVVLLPGESLAWTLVSGAASATLSPTGVFTATAPGTVHVKVAETAANLSAEADITVVAAGGGNTGGGLANSSWPALFGNAQNTGRGGGMGATGTLLWQYGDSTTNLNGGAVVGTDGTVYVSVGIGPVFSPVIPKLIALDGATGSVKWTITLNASQTGLPGTPTLGANGLIYVVYESSLDTASGTLLAVDAQSGATRWHFDTSEQFQSNSVAIGSGTVYLQGGGHLFALDAQTGTQKWSITNSTSLHTTPALSADSGTLYLAANSTLFALDATSGAQKWKVSGANTGRFSTPTVGANGLIYTVNEDLVTNAYAFDSSGVQKWAAHVGDSIIHDTAPAIGADGTVYIIGPDGTTYALDGATGAQKWASESKSGANFSAPAVDAGGTVYVYSDSDRMLHALDGQTGAQKFAVPTNSNGNTIAFTAIGADGTLYFAGLQGITAYR